MGQRTVEHLLNELRRLEASDAPEHAKLRSAFVALQNYRLTRETGRRLSDAEWVGILLSGRDLLDSAGQDTGMAREAIALAIEHTMSTDDGGTMPGGMAR